VSAPFRVGYVPGVMPDTWARRWADRSRRPLELVPVDDADQLTVLRDGTVAMCLLRLPVDTDGLHLVRLYVEEPVVVVGVDHPVAAYDEIAIADLADEPRVDPGWPLRHAMDAVAAGSGIVVVPLSLARLHHRKDVTARPVTGVEGSEVGLAWRTDLDDPDTDTFVGVVRGRTAHSSRGQGDVAPEKKTKKAAQKAAQKAVQKKPPQGAGKPRTRQKPAPRRGRKGR
jgi:DNA-binding transcriptional LysR family regulator